MCLVKMQIHLINKNTIPLVQVFILISKLIRNLPLLIKDENLTKKEEEGKSYYLSVVN
jgi:hypothetical protein